MEMFRLRRKAGRLGFVILPNGNGWLLTNQATVKYLVEIRCATKADVAAAIQDIKDHTPMER